MNGEVRWQPGRLEDPLEHLSHVVGGDRCLVDRAEDPRSGLRRHFARHVAEPEDSSILDADDPGGLDAPSASFANSGRDELDGEAVLEASTKALTEMMESLAREYRAAVGRNPRAGERLLAMFTKVQGALARALKQRGEERLRREEFRKTVPQIVRRCAGEVTRPLASMMRENAKNVRQCLAEVSDGKRTVDDFWNYLIRLEMEWPMQLGTAMRAAVAEALKTGEMQVDDATGR